MESISIFQKWISPEADKSTLPLLQDPKVRDELYKLIPSSPQAEHRKWIQELLCEEVIYWAPNVKGIHSYANLESVLKALRAADKVGKKAVFDTLEDLALKLLTGKFQTKLAKAVRRRIKRV